MEFRKMVMITLYARQKKRHRCIKQYGFKAGQEKFNIKSSLPFEPTPCFTLVYILHPHSTLSRSA